MRLRLLFIIGLTCLASVAHAGDETTADSSKPIRPLVFNPTSEGHKGVTGKHTLVINVGAQPGPSGGGSSAYRRRRHHRMAARPGSAPRGLR